jgi:hypothetical protein
VFESPPDEDNLLYFPLSLKREVTLPLHLRFLLSRRLNLLHSLQSLRSLAQRLLPELLYLDPP